ncbi:putative mannitol dehydrogenase [Ramicandelaber brevisporus]|nr:putative mannitol dehydrogenase [Ramicandelaber brevisporus]
MPVDTSATFNAFASHGKGTPIVPWQYNPRPLGPNDIEIAISHCGICGSDIHTLDSGWGPTKYPVVVGHEIVGTVRQVGSAVTRHAIGDRVGVGAQVFACQDRSGCASCAAKDEPHCPKGVYTYNAKYADGETAYGGYAEAVRVDANFAVSVPAEISSEHAAPLMCAGVTVFTPILRHNVKAGDRVGVIGIGGLGHLAIQFAAKIGAKVTAFSTSDNKREECKTLGASTFVNTKKPEDVAAAQNSLDFLLVTANADGMPWNTYLSTMARAGKVIILGLPESDASLNLGALVRKDLILTGSLIGTPAELEQTLEFAAKHGVRPMIECMPMSQVNEGIAHVNSGKVRYRVVLEN